ncbi:ABC transporter ATP-binding protein [Micromonospora rosaria]|uniref:ABC transporter ATP-binding protein n=1 Tax=Micromonospora rosaria TaxID=47874 RepID=UPI0008332E62|nr:ATP-binding cassette domain-containing protein [Micromonospora rosaria]
MSGVLLRVAALRAEAGGRRLVDDVSFTLAAGRVLALVGMSGSGKTTIGRALLGEAGPGVRLTGRVEVAGRPVDPAHPPPAGTVGYVPQQPSAVLNPVRRVGTVLHEIARRHLPPGGTWRERRDRPRRAVREALRRVALPTDRDLLRRFPHQLSGGQQQRLVVAHALLAGAHLLVADEPTTGQDNLTRRDVAAELSALAGAGMAVLLLSHDLHLVRAVADEMLVLHRGRRVEAGPTAEVFAAPRHEWTRRLLAAPPADARPGTASCLTEDRPGTPSRLAHDRPGTPSRLAHDRHTAPSRLAHERPGTPPCLTDDRPGTPERPSLLAVADLVAEHTGGGRRRTVLTGVGLTLAAGECLALVGRSGSGKTTLARCVAGLHRPRAGTVRLAGRPLATTLDRRDRADLAAVQYVFQDARASFDPGRPVLDQVARPAVRLGGRSVGAAREAARAVLDRVGLAGHLVTRDPGRLSGGELHRAALARALLAGPRVLICDEITAGLDAVTRDRILTLVDELRRADGLALLVISHDREVVARLADRVAVLHDGRVVEDGPAATMLTAARHSLSRSLLHDAAQGARQPHPHGDVSPTPATARRPAPDQHRRTPMCGPTSTGKSQLE